MTTITPDMLLAYIFEIAPDSVTILQNAGIKCTGCNVRTDRPLSEMMQELAPEKAEKLLTHLNKLPQSDKELPRPQKQDDALQKIKEGSKTYYRLAGVLFTESAYSNLHQIQSARGLRIKLTTGGCSGFKYEYDFCEKAAGDEREYPLSETLSLFMNDFTFGRTYGSVVEFKLGLHESGLTIINPHKKRACSCGVSIAF